MKMGLTINTTPARFDIEVTHAKVERTSTQAKLELTQKPPVVNIETEQPRLLIDQYDCFAEEGLKNNLDLLRDQAERAHQNVLEYIGKKAEDGDSMAKIGHKASIMLDIIARDSRTEHEFGMVTIPTARPNIELVGGTVRYDPEDRNLPGEINGVSGNYIKGNIDTNYSPWKVDLRMLSYGSIDIKYTGNNVDEYV